MQDNHLSFIPLSKPSIGGSEIDEVVDSLRSGWITTGPKVAKFEKIFCERLNVQSALAVSSGTAAWHLLAHSLNIGSGDEVILSAITWPSMANVIEHLGAKPVFADVDSTTVMMAPAEVERLITNRTRAILPVHYAGAPADIEAYRSVIGKRNIVIVEDAAHALGTHSRGHEVGTNADAAIFSFHPTKNITTGEGGLLVCKNPEIMARARLLSLHGIGKNAWDRVAESNASYNLTEPGYKYNMLDIQAAIGIQQLPKLEKFIQKRTALAHKYQQLLVDIDQINSIELVNYQHRHAWHIYPVVLDLVALNMSRNEFIDKLRSQKIGVGVHFEAVHLLDYYRKKYGYNEKDLPNSVALGSSLISLPLFPSLTEEEQIRIVYALKDIAEN